MARRHGCIAGIIICAVIVYRKFAALRTSLPASSHDSKFAYVFYVTDSHYACYALANVETMINELHIDKSIDIVLFVEVSGVEKFSDFQNDYYKSRAMCALEICRQV